MDSAPVIPWWTRTGEFERTSFMPLPLRMSSSNSSKSLSPYLDNILIRKCVNVGPKQALPQMYSLESLISKPITPKTEFHEAEQFVRDYVLAATGCGSKNIRKGMMILKPMVSTIMCTEVQIPDCNVLGGKDDCTVLICEVDSGKSWYSTTRKLSMHLCQMLVSLRNRIVRGERCQEKRLSGFYFPFRIIEHVILVTVEWSDEKYKFLESHTQLQQPDVCSKIRSVYQSNHRMWAESEVGSGALLSYPLSSVALHATYGDEAVQVSSGHSIVVISERQKKVYKYCFDNADVVHLLSFQRFTNAQIGFPTGHTFIKEVCVFVFELYSPPLPVKVIREHSIWFCRSLVDALRQLHHLGYAHLDIRRENVCFGEDGRCILIDLEKSRDKYGSASLLLHKYEECESYRPANSSWTYVNIDYKQLGLLFDSLFPLRARHGFIQKLVSEGEYCNDLFKEYCEHLCAEYQP